MDELALQFDDSFLTIWQVTEAQLIDAPASEATALNDFLSSFSGQENASLWTEEALYTEQVWEHVREPAGFCSSSSTCSDGGAGRERLGAVL